MRINPRLSEESSRTIQEEIGACEDWSEKVAYSTLLRIVAIVSGAIFIGGDLCRSEEYLKSSIGYTLDFVGAVSGLKRWSKRWRWLGSYFVPEVKKLFAERKKAHDFLEPIIAKRRAAMKAGEDMPDDTLQWMIEKAAKFNLSDDELAESQLNLSMAAIHTTTLTVTMMLVSLTPSTYI